MFSLSSSQVKSMDNTERRPEAIARRIVISSRDAAGNQRGRLSSRLIFFLLSFFLCVAPRTKHARRRFK